MTYSEKLKDPRWQKKRLEILQRDEFTCQWCGDVKTTLHVHHDYYEAEYPWDDQEEFLTTVCEDCHNLHHILNPLENFLLQCIRNLHRGETDYIKMMNRVVRNLKERNGKAAIH